MFVYYLHTCPILNLIANSTHSQINYNLLFKKEKRHIKIEYRNVKYIKTKISNNNEKKNQKIKFVHLVYNYITFNFSFPYFEYGRI